MDEWVLPSLGSWIAQTENVLRRGDREYNIFVRDPDGNTYYFFQYQYLRRKESVMLLGNLGAFPNPPWLAGRAVWRHC
jgi:hypothetical protein